MAETPPAPLPQPKPLWLQLLPLAVILAVLAAAWAGGVFDYFSLDGLRQNRAVLTAYVAAHRLLALLAFMAVFALATACAVPGTMWLIIGAGFLFGVPVAALAVILAATLGATALFLVARTTFGAGLARRAGPFLRRLERGFRQDEVFFMLAMRLMPGLPYPVSNIAPALLGARLGNFVWTTPLGIAPGVLAYAWIGDGLGGVLEAGQSPSIQALLQQATAPLIALACLALLAIVVRRIAARRVIE